MSIVDIIAIVVVVLSMLLGLLRGLVREVFSLAGWVVAGIVAVLYGGWAAQFVPPLLPSPLFQTVAGHVIVFVIVLVGGGLLGLLLGRLIRAAGLGAGDRFLGAVFGVVRGVLILTVGVMLASLTPIVHESFWRSATVVGPIEGLVAALQPYLPEAIAARMQLGKV